MSLEKVFGQKPWLRREDPSGCRIGRKAESEQSQISGDLDIKEAISMQLPVGLEPPAWHTDGA